ncbi:T9SS type A sorting domain-containing protein [Hymenobacter sp. CRA2]|uniref:T9SS type A sorting domain-containing protein n=1 Tax=Hymenobacter sp. CRA2 TaxID=1955620 RepID=UPI00098F4B76|nr:T9SS type A sorting domain-containing protein [Hymenobacter sp. CRA2]OON70726.1 hypothetical protein B0919_01550 [Hymenobacter sp. CRA2]
MPNIYLASARTWLIFIALLLGRLHFTRAQQLQESLWTTDGEVTALEHTGSTLYVGGQFHYVGPRTGGAAPVEATTGALQAGFPVINGPVYTSIPDGNGGWYLGGAFDQVGTYTRNSLVHVLSDFTVDPAFNPTGGYTGIGTYSISVKSLARVGSTLYVAGGFQYLGRNFRQNLGAVDLTTNTVTSWTNSTNYVVNAIAAGANALYLCGDFTTVQNTARPHAAAVSLTTGALLPWNPTITYSQGSSRFYTAAVLGSVVYLGGQELGSGSNWDTGLLALDAATAQPVAQWRAALPGPTRALLIDNNRLYAGGQFASNTTGIQILEPATGAAVATPIAMEGAVYALALRNGILYAGGTFEECGGMPHRRLAAFDAATGALQTWAAHTNSTVQTLTVGNNTLYVGGTLSSVGGLPRSYAAAFNAATGQPTAWNPAPNGPVQALRRYGRNMFLGGKFSRLGASVRSNLAQVDTLTGQPTAWQVSAEPASEGVRALVVDADSILHVGGTFTSLAQQPRWGYGAVHARTGQLRPLLPAGQLTYRVYGLALSGDTLYAAGDNTNTSGLYEVVLSSGSSRNLLSTAYFVNGFAEMNAVAVVGNRVYAGGYGAYYPTGNFPGQPCVVAFDRRTAALINWDPGLRNWGSANPYASPRANAIATEGNKVYIGGQYMGPTTSSVPSSSPGTNTYAYSLLAVDSLVAGYCAPWKAYFTSWHDYQSSLDMEVKALLVKDGKVYVGGSFRNINGQARYGLACLSAAASAANAINFTAPPALVAGAPYTLQASALAGLPVRFRVVRGTATLAGNRLTVPAAGTVEVEAYQYGSAAYDAAPSVRRTITVTASPTAATTPGTVLRLHPNPATDYVSVPVNVAGPVEVRLYNLQGQLVLVHTAATRQAITLDLTSLPAGVYLTEVTGPNYRATSRLLKQ